jgi:hypothetical protein
LGLDTRTEAIEEALAVLRDQLEVEEHQPSPASHVVVRVAGAEAAECVDAFGTYLTGLVANVLSVDLRLADTLLGAHEDATQQLISDISKLVGESNVVNDAGAAGTITSDFREDYRNPWIAEGIAHLVVCLPEQVPGPCIPGRVHVLTLPHHKSSQQGLDAVAVYDEGDLLAASIGEAKASEQHPSARLSEAISLFKEIDAGSREHEIRSVMNMLAGYLPEDVRLRLIPSFWRDRRLYLPTIGYSSEAPFAPAQNRPETFGLLEPSRERRRLVILPLEDYHGFFDGVADAMRAATRA